MALQTVGLKTQIWNNNIWSLAMLSTLPVTLFLMVWGTVYVYFDLENKGLFIDDFWSTLFMSKRGEPLLDKLIHQDVGGESLELAIVALPFVLIVVALWYGIAWGLNAKIMRGLTGADLVTRASHPGLYNLVENLAISCGMSTPKISVLNSYTLNAFASGVDRQSYMITVTSGLVDQLSKEELKAVLAHELTHIRNNDVRLMVIVSIFAGMISVLMSLAGHLMLPKLFQSDDIDGVPMPHPGYYLFMMMVWVFANLALGVTMASKYAISRRREYMADAGAVELTKNPNAMISALEKLDGRSLTHQIPGDIAEMCFMPSVIHDLLSTHPPINDRIKAIRRYAGAGLQESKARDTSRRRGGRMPRADSIHWARKARIATALAESASFGKRNVSRD